MSATGNGQHTEPDTTNGGVSGGEPLWEKQVFTTGEAAEVCKVSQQTIIRCFDAGRLRGFRVPGSRFRRIPREELLRFMKDNGIPLENLAGPRSKKKRVLVVDDDPDLIDLFTEVLGHDGRFEVRTASTGYDAGMLSESFRPDLMVLDFMLPDINGNVVCKAVRNNPDLANTRIIFVSGVVSQDDIDGLMAAGADDFIKKPFNIEQLVERIATLLEA